MLGPRSADESEPYRGRAEHDLDQRPTRPPNRRGGRLLRGGAQASVGSRRLPPQERASKHLERCQSGADRAPVHGEERACGGELGPGSACVGAVSVRLLGGRRRVRPATQSRAPLSCGDSAARSVRTSLGSADHARTPRVDLLQPSRRSEGFASQATSLRAHSSRSIMSIDSAHERRHSSLKIPTCASRRDCTACSRRC